MDARSIWKEILVTTIKSRSKKSGIVKNGDSIEVKEEELKEFEELVGELSFDISAAEHINILTSESMIIEHEIDW